MIDDTELTMRRSTASAFSAIRYARNMRVEQVASCPLVAASEPWHRGEASNWAFEEWAAARRATRAFVASMVEDRPIDLPLPVPHWWGWSGFRWTQTYCSTPNRKGRKVLLDYRRRGSLFECPGLWERVRTEYLARPVYWVVVGCGVAVVVLARWMGVI